MYCVPRYFALRFAAKVVYVFWGLQTKTEGGDMRTHSWFILSAAVIVATFSAIAAEVTLTGSTLQVKSDTLEAVGDCVTGKITFKAGGIEISGVGQLLAVRPDGWVSSLLAGGSDRYLADNDTLAVQMSSEGGPAMVVLASPSGRASICRLPLNTLGLRSGKIYAAYDVVGDKLSGPMLSYLLQAIPEGKPAVVALAEAGAHPVVVAASDTQTNPKGSVGVWDETKSTLSGTATLEAGKPYEVRIAAPGYKADSASLNGGEATVKQTNEWVRVTLSGKAGASAWSVKFSKGAAAGEKPAAATLQATAQGPRCVSVASSLSGMNVVLRRNDGKEFVMVEPSITDTTTSPENKYTYALQVVDWSGKAQDVATASVTTPGKPELPPLPNVYLGDLTPAKATNGWNGDPRKDKSIQDNPIRIRGEEFKRGMGVHAVSELVYDAKPEWKRFVAVVGTDDEEKGGSVGFSVFADGKQLIKTPTLTDGDERFCINIEVPAGTKQIRLAVDDGGNGNGADHADWANAGFLTK